jgi:death-on-curing protein
VAGSLGPENEPVWLEFADALELYAAIIGCTTEEAADQLRDRTGLESALGRPRNYLLYEQADLALQAAALAHGIAESQTFIDGNKRLALVAMLTFLDINGLAVDAPDPELVRWILSLSAGATHAELADLIRSRLGPVK